MPTDLDGDSQMASSPESSVGSPAGSRTPTNNADLDDPHSDFAGATELSPPGSQTQNFPDVTEMVGLEGNGPAGGSSAQISAQPQPQQQQQQPGAMWMNKRAEEEYQRALEYVVDKDFNLDEFGDPFDERDMDEDTF
ncbi:uncharacterized protein ACLA_050800 [Aspergillus clavatus NRRL 1]|uniref:Uncharacterized protein n=1 Tax=Aspergillus clavatus (strain ATCC 1007 / CBS 513.65 / DSM 816 / NCTC 3887 / NRRL 1 / QM 1276 / 107) TaxID=344612 RepID=A1CIA3_ASPCL|nr:uncharacterized protein ACLA_050800 [Aspergillus clavatus NRRL 1]EAW10608.1 conserved hypothetical protein [Aspergillus clavatus NRRL 1]